MFRTTLCPSSGAEEYYTVVAACGIWCSILQTGHIALSTTPEQQLKNRSTKYHRQQYSSAPDDGHNGARNMLSKQ